MKHPSCLKVLDTYRIGSALRVLTPLIWENVNPCGRVYDAPIAAPVIQLAAGDTSVGSTPCSSELAGCSHMAYIEMQNGASPPGGIA